MQYADLYLDRFDVLFSNFDFIHYICHIKPKIGRWVFFYNLHLFVLLYVNFVIKNSIF